MVGKVVFYFLLKGFQKINILNSQKCMQFYEIQQRIQDGFRNKIFYVVCLKWKVYISSFFYNTLTDINQKQRILNFLFSNMHKTTSSFHYKQNAYTPDNSGSSFPTSSKAAIDFSMISLAKKAYRLRNQMSEGTAEAKALLDTTKQRFEEGVEESTSCVQDSASKLQTLQGETLEICKKKSMETSQADREIVTNFQSRKIKPRVDIFQQNFRENTISKVKEINCMENRLSQLGLQLNETKKNSQQQLYLMLGDVQGQMDTLEQTIAEFEGRCRESLNYIEEKAQDVCGNLDACIRREIILGKKDHQLVENLVEKLINKMTAL